LIRLHEAGPETGVIKVQFLYRVQMVAGYLQLDFRSGPATERVASVEPNQGQLGLDFTAKEEE
jgi:hypothetical protein